MGALRIVNVPRRRDRRTAARPWRQRKSSESSGIATDVAIVTSFGPCTLVGFKVITDEVTSTDPGTL